MTVSEASGYMCGKGGRGDEVLGAQVAQGPPLFCRSQRGPVWEEVCTGYRAWEKPQCSLWILWVFPERFHAPERYSSTAGVTNKL